MYSRVKEMHLKKQLKLIGSKFEYLFSKKLPENSSVTSAKRGQTQ